MSDKYQIEIDEFVRNFAKYKNLNIVIYGIGRYTATLLEGVKGFRFVGLMDKDPKNTGKKIFGLPVVNQATAEDIADMIVINTSETYWNVIYDRIQGARIPVFYKNGEKAKKKIDIKFENPFKGLSCKELYLQIDVSEVISFDFFDTLFMRSVCNPQDIFLILEKELEKNVITNFLETRNKAKKRIRRNYSIDELYSQIQKVSGISAGLAEHIKSKELELEKKQLVPRWEIIYGLRRALESGKIVYIISDMYLPELFYRGILEQYHISLPAGHILLSNRLDKNKADGTMWKYYSENIVKGRRALHIGDNQKADIKEPVKCNLGTYLVPSAWDLLSVSSMQKATLHICGDYESAIIGCVLKELFCNPYTLENSNGMIKIDNNYKMGYCVFGPVILSFLFWLLQQSKKDSVRKLIFMSRDGYFLKEDFEYLCELRGEKIENCYLGISRQLAMTAAIESYEDLMEYASMPYTGNIVELFEDRFEIKGVREIIGKQLEGYIEDYLPDIKKYIAYIRKNYLHYIENIELDNDCAIVDLGYYGNNQKYLNKLLKRKISGYYFNANLSKQNKNIKYQKMMTCFQRREDYTGENSQVLKHMIYLESFLTAPYGMVKAVDRNGTFICGLQKSNQEHFKDKVEINRGVKRFIQEYINLFGEFKIPQNLEFIDWYYGYCFNGAFEFAEKVKKSFYNDNAMMNRIESMLFY